MITRRAFIGTLAGSVLAAPLAGAQPAGKIPRIGYLSPLSPSSDSTRIEAFRQGLRDLGYVEGQNIAIEYRYAERKFDRLPDLAAELVRLKVDVIVAASTPGILLLPPAYHVTTTMVYTHVGNRGAGGSTGPLPLGWCYCPQRNPFCLKGDGS